MLADLVGRSGSHPPSIETPVGRNRGRLQNPAKARLVVIIIRLCRGESRPEKQGTKLMALETGIAQDGQDVIFVGDLVLCLYLKSGQKEAGKRDGF